MSNSQANAERATKAHQAAIQRAQIRARKSRNRKRVGMASAATNVRDNSDDGFGSANQPNQQTTTTPARTSPAPSTRAS